MHFIFKFISIYFLIISSSFAYDNYNECRQFREKIQKISLHSELDNSPVRSEKIFGIDLDFDAEFGIYLSKIHPTTFIDYADDKEFELNNLESNYLSELNGVDVSKITEESFKKELSKEVLTFKTESNDKLYKLNKRIFEKVELYIAPNINNISKIDSKSSSFEASFEIKTSWWDDRFSEVAEEVYIEGNQKRRSKTENKNEEDYSFFCILDNAFFKSFNYPIPDISPSSFINNVNFQDKVKYKFDYYPPSECDDSKCSAVEKINGIAVFTKHNYYEGTFDNNFNFTKFPFDKQRLFLDLEPYQYDDSFTIPYVNQVGFDNLYVNYLNFTSPEWNYVDYDASYGHLSNNEDDNRYPYVNVYFDIERLSNYYIFKVMLPIVFLLIISWSVFWINPKDLESRVTVSIVCLLSLIAYNFVIDNDLPKLGYLTFMDRFILISYLFSGIPTIQTIITRYLLDNGKIDLSLSVDKNSKIFVPPSYFFAILMTFIDYDINPFV